MAAIAVPAGPNIHRPFTLNPKQIELRALVGGDATHCLNYGGTRGGKTFAFLYCIVLRAILAPGSRHLICRFRFNAVRRTIRLDTFPKLMRLAFPGVKWEPKDKDGYILFPNGSEIWFGGLDNPERIDKILGAEYATIFINEASEVKHEVVGTLRTRLAQSVLIAEGPRKGELLRRKMYYDLNPTTKKHWSYREFVQKVTADKGLPLRRPEDYVYLKTNPQDNEINLAEGFVDSLDDLSRLQKIRFKDGDYLQEVDGALWNDGMFRRVARGSVGVRYGRTVVAVDPSGARHEKDVTADEIGIIVASKGEDGIGYIREDLSIRTSPAVWASLVAETARRVGADAIVFEKNYGGPMGESLIRGYDSNLNVKMVDASSGKHVRAEPIAALYERALIRHVGEPEEYEILEDQLMAFTISGYAGLGSPDRGDALVWALTELMLGPAETRTRGGSAFDLASRSHGAH